MKKTKGKVFVGMSGGVDSSVAAALLKQQGYEVIGVHLKCFNVDGCAAQDAEDARRAAEHLGIPFYTFDFEKEYKKKVVEYMIDGYKKGITPNPDVMCNKEIKFGLFYKKAMEMGADCVATGHYVRLVTSKQGLVNKKNRRAKKSLVTSYQLLVARDGNKDQSYFLWTLKQDQLKHCLFPIGEYKKPRVRKLAAKFGLHNAEKKDSQGICFLGQVSLPDFLKKYIKPRKGPIVIADSSSVIANEMKSRFREAESRILDWQNQSEQSYNIIGTHNGAHFYTIGQRSGLGIGGFEKPLYVAEKDVKKNIITVAEGDTHPALYKKEIELADVNLFFEPRSSNFKLPVLARVRYRQPLVKAKLYLYPNSHELGYRPKLVIRQSKRKNQLPITPVPEQSTVRGAANYHLLFAKPVKFVAEGQSAVFYDKNGAMLGGGIIKTAL